MRNILTFILLTLTGIGIHAQRFEIERVECAPFDMTAAHHVRMSLADEPCALVKVEVASPNARFQGNTVGDIAYSTGEYMVYMSPGTKELRVLHEALLPLRVYFPDYDIPHLSSKVTYVVTLRFPDAVSVTDTPSVTTPYLYPFQDLSTDYWGFRNVMGQEIVSPRYEEAEVIADDLIFVKKLGKWGIIDNKGHQRLAPLADENSQVCVADSLILFEKGGRWGAVDAGGKERLPFIFGDMKLFGGITWSGAGFSTVYQPGHPHRGTRFAAQKEGKYALYDAATCRALTPHIYEDMLSVDYLFYGSGFEIRNPNPSKLIAVKKDGVWGFMDAEGKEVIPARYDHTDDYRNRLFMNGRAIVRLDGKYGIIDERGKTIVPFEYKFISMRFDHANVRTYISLLKDDNSNFVLYDDGYNKLGEFPISWVNGLYDDIIIGQDNSYQKKVFNLRTGRQLLPAPGYEDFSHGAANMVIVQRDKKYGCIDAYGNEVVPCKFDGISRESAANGCIAVCLDGKWGLYNLGGYMVLEPEFEHVWAVQADGLCKVLTDLTGGCALYNIKGKRMGGEYSDIAYEPFVQGDFMARGVCRDHKWGYIDPSGREIVETAYTDKDQALAALHRYMLQRGIKVQQGPIRIKDAF